MIRVGCLDGRPASRAAGASWIFLMVALSLTGHPRGAHAQDISGIVSLPDSTPVAAARVELHVVSGESGALLDSTRSDDSGRFTFEVEAGLDPAALFLVGAEYRGIMYWGVPGHASARVGNGAFAVSVFDTTRVAEPLETLEVSMRHAVLRPGPAGIQVDEVIDIRGLSDRTVISDSYPDSGLVWTTSLARGAVGIVPAPGGVPVKDVAAGGGRVGFRGALPPAGARLVVQYAIPAGEYSVGLDHSTRRMEVLVMDRPGLKLSVDGLEEVRLRDTLQIPIRRFAGAGLPAGGRVSIRAEVTPVGRGAARAWLLVAVALAAAAVLSVRLGRRQG